MKTSEVLNRAADVIQRDGWYQGGYSPDADKAMTTLVGRPVCALGAIHVAADEWLLWFEDLQCWAGGRTPVTDVVAKILARHIDHPDLFIPAWNDHEGRTAAEVIEALRAAAIIEAAREDAAAPVEVSA
jgi:hypothetical protein